MTALDDKLLPMVKTIVEKYGKNVIFAVPTSYVHDSVTGEVTESGVTNYTLKVTPPDKYDLKYVDGDVIRTGDTRILLPAKDLEFVPNRGHEVQIESERWTIVSVKPYYSGDSVCVFEIQLRV